LPNLQAVVFVGRKAEKARLEVTQLRPNLALFVCPHPSPMFVNHAPGNRDRILLLLRDVADCMSMARAQDPL